MTVEVRLLDGPAGPRRVVWVELGGETPSGFRGVPLGSTTSAMVEMAADDGAGRVDAARRRDGVDGSDILEGVAALDGWGRLAKALVSCSGIVPTIMVVDGPAVSGPALLLGVADLVVMTTTSYAFVNGPVMVEEFTGVRISTDELGGSGRAGPPHRRAEPRRRPPATRRSRPSPTCWPTCRRASTTTRPAGTATTRPTGRARRPAR